MCDYYTFSFGHKGHKAFPCDLAFLNIIIRHNQQLDII